MQKLLYLINIQVHRSQKCDASTMLCIAPIAVQRSTVYYNLPYFQLMRKVFSSIPSAIKIADNVPGLHHT